MFNPEEEYGQFSLKFHFILVFVADKNDTQCKVLYFEICLPPGNLGV